MTSVPSRIGYVLSDDLMFTSRIVGTGRDLGYAFRAAKSTEALMHLAGGTAAACVIIDLANPTLRILEFVRALKGLAPAPTVVAYGSHVDKESLAAACNAGCDVVLPRSQFVEQLPTELTAWMQSASAG